MEKLDYERHARPGDEERRRPLMSVAKFGLITIAATLAVNASAIYLIANPPAAFAVAWLPLVILLLGPLANLLVFIVAIIAANRAAVGEERGPRIFFAMFAPLFGGIVSVIATVVLLLI